MSQSSKLTTPTQKSAPAHISTVLSAISVLNNKSLPNENIVSTHTRLQLPPPPLLCVSIHSAPLGRGFAVWNWNECLTNCEMFAGKTSQEFSKRPADTSQSLEPSSP